MTPLDPFDGALLVDKPPGLTSHDVVHRLRRHLAIKKVGHCGTLDPAATGLLVILLGRATKLSEILMGADKVYEGRLRLGESTQTYDADGDITASLPVPPLTLDSLNEYTTAFLGDQLQTPPMVSAIKIQGVPLYKLARQGLDVPREPRLVHIYSFRFSHYQEPFADFRLACTKGTYIRSIAHDLGQNVGCGAHLVALRRLESGQFHVRDALPLDQLLQQTPASVMPRILPLTQLQ